MMFTAIGMSRAGLVGALTLAVALIFLARPGAYAPAAQERHAGHRRARWRR